MTASRFLPPARPLLLHLAVRAALLSLLSGATLAAPAYAQQQPQPAPVATLNIPAGSLAEALQTLASQSGVTLQADARLTAGRSAPALQGSYALDAAFVALLAGTPLQARADGAGHYVLLQSSAGALGEILVTAERDRAATRAGTTTIIGMGSIERDNPATMAGLARYEPLISVPLAASGGGNVWDGSGNTGFNIRGLEGNRVGLDIDGIAMPDAAPKPDAATTNSFGIGRDYFDPDTFREVRIDSGTSVVGAGVPGLAGSVSFITKAPSDYLSDTRHAYIEYKAGYQSADGSRSQAVTAALRADDVDMLAVLVHRNGEQQGNKGSVAANPADWTSDAILAKMDWHLNGEHLLGATIDAYKRSGTDQYNNKVATSYPNGATGQDTTRRNRFSLSDRYAPADLALFDTLTTRAYVQDARQEDVTDALYITGGQQVQRHINTGYYDKRYGLTSDAVKKLNPDNVLGYGVAISKEKLRRPWTEDRTVLATGVHQYTSKERMADSDTDDLVLYATDDYGFRLGGYKATLTPGLRAEHRTLTPKNLENYVVAVPTAAAELGKRSDNVVTPSLGLAIQLTPELTTYASYVHGTRLPTATELNGTYDSFSYTGTGAGYAVLGNENLKKETSDAVEVGLKGTATKGVTFTSSLFYTKYRNFIEYAAQPVDLATYPTLSYGLYRPENLSKAKIWGAEFSSHFELGAWSAPLTGLSVALAAGITHSDAEDTSTGKSGSLASVLPFKSSAILSYDAPRQLFGLALATVYNDAKQATSEVTSSATTTYFAVPSSTVIDLTGYWTITPHAKLNFGVYNLADRQYWDYASTRTLAAGTNASNLAEIQREARPGRNYGVNLAISF